MNSTLVTLLDQDTQEWLLAIDATESEMHAGEVEATDHPVEQGANITDHLRPKPRTLVLTGWISNTPIVDNGRGTAGPYTMGDPGPVEDHYSKLEARRLAGRLHTVVTKLATYENMALISISEPRDHATGDVLAFSLTFKEITVVYNQTITIKTAAPQGQPKKTTGKKNTTPAQPSASAASVADKIFYKGK